MSKSYGSVPMTKEKVVVPKVVYFFMASSLELSNAAFSDFFSSSFNKSEPSGKIRARIAAPVMLSNSSRSVCFFSRQYVQIIAL